MNVKENVLPNNNEKDHEIQKTDRIYSIFLNGN
jgi:hypothetical protein